MSTPAALPLLIRRAVLLAATGSVLLAGCASVLPDKPARPTLYDFGPGASAPRPAADGTAQLPPIALAEVQPAGALDGSTALWYRLGYTDARQLRPYSQARWSTPPAQLVGQQLAAELGRRRPVLVAGESAALVRTEGRLPLVLRTNLEEFSHVFSSPTDSAGLIRLRVTLVDDTPAGERLLGQRQVVVQRPAPSADAAGGVQALVEATQAAVREIADWVEQSGR
ncbi:ABC-type transport auxiliary lipoprotein family protein [Xylophilus sp.]|uniref:ABC-type transport auxiliary lipoprotein family protein n=1 Tax=Xylophilus sp. TaxID=2653893 RepID=UPI0013BA9DC9|nr:ABC-type transport auxiliary lipoprotein family protein [Xylophilus sp.]KAF1046308.1 MAG: hypothetical protein GAK38_02548 [Xylophilus sp.]